MAAAPNRLVLNTYDIDGLDGHKDQITDANDKKRLGSEQSARVNLFTEIEEWCNHQLFLRPFAAQQ
ncbi:MAG: hypothetical protein KUG79_13750 [Pseudomonadales bacterium]|nr:hypothetical protein [Pseudomonadales bacterium]